MKKVVVASLSSVILATGVVSPMVNAKENVNNNQSSNVQNGTNVNSEKIARESAKANGADLRAYDSKQMERGKVTWTLKGAKEVLSKNKAKINSAIKTAIEKLPLSKAQKKKWISVITIDGFIKYLNQITNFTGSIEDAAQGWLTSIGVPGWIAQVIVQTISFFLV
ncbi:hypothetical protein [Staphylococcus chromogenes]|uniref:Transglycosylase n=1 Tax=Staphylococcus chromogenes TaxID=46126 RepID=A0ABD5AYP1_STACR|nr:hypothetical protein [Staphylococcus chromogenes]MCE4967168.1 hypothetical protein [Staphylococcus chromogenes]MDQ7176503.1 hypothetical protein [Staphylococcus chromogenes]PTF29503.1 hypothetical protein BUY14_10505 [Staphylococcus chromogenes]PTF74349.1 hypothetical protein BUX97_10220 [Staphylococcus chromogenes]PTF75765.1 hypothetical protein BU686_10305 [Staphylococcus chromogenes]